LQEKKRTSYIYLGMMLLSILGIMEVIFLMTYMKPGDGAVWSECAEGLKVQRILYEFETPLQEGDMLISMDDVTIKDLQAYEDELFRYSVGSKHLYSLERDGSFFEPWVHIFGLRDIPEAYFFFALSGFLFLLFSFLISGQHIPDTERYHLIFLSLCVYTSFIFFRTDLLTPLDWVSFFLNLTGRAYLGSCFLDAILGESAKKKAGPLRLSYIHWSVSHSLFGLTMFFLLGAYRFHFSSPFSLAGLQTIQNYWTVSLIVLGLILARGIPSIGKQWKGLFWAWMFSFLPIAAFIIKLKYPFSAYFAAILSGILPFAIFFKWKKTYRIFLEGGARQMAIYATIILILFLGFFLFLGSFYQLLSGKMSSETQLILSSFGLVLAAIAFTPLKRISENFWNKIVYGERLNALKNLHDVGSINRADTSPNEFFSVMLQKIQRGFGIQTAHAYVYNKFRNAFIDIDKNMPIIHQNRFKKPLPHGEICSAEDAGLNEEPFRPHDLFLPMVINDHMVAFLYLSNGAEVITLSQEENQLMRNLLNQCEVLLENMELYRDANEKAHRIEKLREFNESIIESSQIGMVAVDELGLIVSCNRAFVSITGFHRGDPKGLRFHYLLEEVKIEKTYQGKNGEVIEGRFRNPNGRIRFLELQKTPLKSRENEIFGTLYLVEDIREKKEVQRKMIQQEKLASIGLLAAGVAHEINTPLTGIKSYAQMLMQEELEEEQRELVDNVLQQSNRAGRIVRDLLDFTRKDTSTDEIINLNHVVEQTFTLLAHTLKKNQISYSFTPEKSIIFIKGNANQLQQVFINLVVNAIDAMQPEGVLRVTVDEKKDGIHALVQDNGTGIDSQTINRMFDPFFTTKEAGKGTGLGLSVVYNILHEHRAEISVNSKQGEGTTMHILFPSPGSIDHG